MKVTPIDYDIVTREIKESGLKNISKASIREVRHLINNIEKATGKRFIRMEMGVPGLPTPSIAVDGEIQALKSGKSAIYPELDGVKELKYEIMRFVKNFLDLSVKPEHCFPVVGSAQGGFITFLTIDRLYEDKNTIVFIDPGFPLQKQQIKVLGQKYENFDVYNFRGNKLKDKLEAYFKKGNVHSVLYNNPNNPTWICFTDEELQIIGSLANKYNIIVIEDLAYLGMDFRKDYSQPAKPPFQPTVGKYTDNFILLISSSKMFSYAGQRCGMMVISDKVFNIRSSALKRYFTSDCLGYCMLYGTLYAASSGVSHTAQYGLASVLKAVTDGTYNYRNDVIEYGEKAKIMKKLFLENGFKIVYDKDGDEPIADGFYFTISYPGLSAEELLREFLYYGISAISLDITGSESTEGIRACVSLVQRSQFPDLEERLKKFKEQQDETEYLLQSEANRKMLLESIKQAERGELIKVNIGKAKKK